MATPVNIRVRLVIRVALLAAFACAAAVPAQAQHRARLSADLASHAGGSVEVIVDGAATADKLAAKYNLKVRRMKSGGVLTVNGSQLAALAQDADLDHLSSNSRYHSSSVVDPIDVGIGADQVWAGAGALPKLSGKGVTVAVIDSGMDQTHNALKGRVLTTVDFTGGDGVDKFGHGTHVSAIIAGNQGLLSTTKMYRGVASGTSLINLRVLGADGSGLASDVVEAIDWAIDHQRAYNIRVINLSLGAPVLQSYRDDPVCAAVERAVRAGILVVTAAGNHGQTPDGKTMAGGITSPGNSPFSLTVGALDTKGTADRGDDEVATFSSNGPTAFDHVLKPDLVAPGRRITSAEVVGSVLSVAAQHVAGSGPNAYIYGSGTSMATAFVSGAAALLLDERPNLDPLSVKATLQMTSSFLPEAGLIRSGAGSLNVLAAADFALDGDLGTTTIAGDAVASSHLVIASAQQIVSAEGVYQSKRLSFHALRAASRKKSGVHAAAKAASDSLVWGASHDSLVWGASHDSLVWGASDDSLVWGASGSLVWGASDGSLVWGASDDSLVWGASGDSLVWGASDDSLVWGASGDSLVWGASDDSLVWGASDDSLVWGASDDSLVWGASASLVWCA